MMRFGHCCKTIPAFAFLTNSFQQATTMEAKLKVFGDAMRNMNYAPSFEDTNSDKTMTNACIVLVNEDGQPKMADARTKFLVSPDFGTLKLQPNQHP